MGVKMIADKRRKPSRARMLVVEKERAAHKEHLSILAARQERKFIIYGDKPIVTFRNGVKVN